MENLLLYIESRHSKESADLLMANTKFIIIQSLRYAVLTRDGCAVIP